MPKKLDINYVLKYDNSHFYIVCAILILKPNWQEQKKIKKIVPL